MRDTFIFKSTLAALSFSFLPIFSAWGMEQSTDTERVQHAQKVQANKDERHKLDKEADEQFGKKWAEVKEVEGGKLSTGDKIEKETERAAKDIKKTFGL